MLAGAGAAVTPAAEPTPRVFTNDDLAPARAPAAPRARSRSGEVVVRGPGEAALVQPTLAFELRDRRTRRPLARDEGVLTPDESVLGALLRGIRDGAILDTGASAHLLASATARTYGLEADGGARYVETGMTGEHAMGVSRELDVALPAGTSPRVFTAQRFLLNEAPTDLASLALSPGAMADVIGMPILRELVMVIETDGADPAPISVRLLTSAPPADAWIALRMRDFNRRRHPRNRGALPTLGANPVVEDVEVGLGGRTTVGDWLLDTGAAVTMISTATARAIGVGGAPAFGVPVGGISGARTLDGFVIDRVVMRSTAGGTVVFERVPVVVHDITTVADDGERVTLDGILGMNLLLPSGSDIGPLGMATTHPPAFTRVVVDGPGSRLGLTPR